MMVTINIPDTLPKKRVWQRIREIEESLKEEASFFQSIIKEKDLSDDDEELFWKSFGSWEDEKSADEIIKDIYSKRTDTDRAALL